MAEEENASSAESPKPKSNTWLIVLVILMTVILLGGGGFAAWHFMANTNPAEASAEDAKPKVPKFVRLEPFVVSLQTSGRPRYMQIKLTLMSRNDEAVKILQVYVPLIRNVIVNYLSQMSYKDATQKDATGMIRESTLSEINGLLVAEKSGVLLDDLLITDLVVQ